MHLLQAQILDFAFYFCLIIAFFKEISSKIKDKTIFLSSIDSVNQNFTDSDLSNAKIMCLNFNIA